MTEREFIDKILSRRLIGKRSESEAKRFLKGRLPHFSCPKSLPAWKARRARRRKAILELIMRGHPKGLLETKPKMEWRGVLETGRGYRIRKLRYEGYPGMWIPALLYEPTQLKGKVPAVLNPNGHHAGGKAMTYKQARCINLAKRGMLALNTEFIGMGELRADVDHNRIGLLDLCGIAGIGVFYLVTKRGLDVLLSHPRADSSRVAMTGLSGGGWQTALLSALDERVRVIVPVAGHSPAWQRVQYHADRGDLEQLPSDFCHTTDWDVLTAFFAPRPSLLIFNRYDDCCYQSSRMRRSLYLPVRPVFRLYGAEANLRFYDNVDPGNHNYEEDNRSQLYKFLNQHFGLNTPDGEVPWKDEVFSEDELRVGLPRKNATLLDLASRAREKIRDQREKKGFLASPRNRQLLKTLLRIPRIAEQPALVRKRITRRRLYTVAECVLKIGEWSIPLTRFMPSRTQGLELSISRDRSNKVLDRVEESLARKIQIMVADIWGSGEGDIGWTYHMLVATTGARSLGLQVAQLGLLLRWAHHENGDSPVHLYGRGTVNAVVALVATLLNRRWVASLTTDGLIDSLGRFIEWPASYEELAPLFCFGLLREFDIPDLIELAHPVVVRDTQRGPLWVNR